MRWHTAFSTLLRAHRWEEKVSEDSFAWPMNMLDFTKRVPPPRRGDGVQLVQRSAEHKGATRNAPWHGLGLEARGTETGRQATQEPKGRATRRREEKEEQ